MHSPNGRDACKLSVALNAMLKTSNDRLMSGLEPSRLTVWRSRLVEVGLALPFRFGCAGAS